MASSISIHSLRMEGDGFSIIYSFLPCISIHSLRMEGDDLFLHSISTRQTFQSTPSAWRETKSVTAIRTTIAFQSTPSAWRETSQGSPFSGRIAISIHSLRMEGDQNTRFSW